MTVLSVSQTTYTVSPRPLEDQVQEFLHYTQALWWNSSSSAPSFKAVYPPQQQAQNEKRLDGLLKGLAHELKRIPAEPAARAAWQQQFRPVVTEFAQDLLHLQPRHLDYIEASGLIESLQNFAREARRFDPHISAEDIYQAGRNVMTANFIQLLLGLPARLTPSIFAYSMLYPYSDNYLDDPGISGAEKRDFNRRFRQRLLGQATPTTNAREQTIHTLIAMIESEWDRARYPLVYQSLLAIHSAQARSLAQVAPGVSPYELDVLGSSFEKGGTSVMADGFLAAGELSEEQAQRLFGFGTFTQLIDDLEDLLADQKENRASVYALTAPHWKLDGLINHTFSYGRQIIADLDAFPGSGVPILSELMGLCLDPILIEIIGRNGRCCSSPYLANLESHMPFRFASLDKARRTLERQKINPGRLVEAMLC